MISNLYCTVGATELFFRDVEGSLGRVFTRFALSYITASRDGLSEMELLDILSTEEEVLNLHNIVAIHNIIVFSFHN